MKQEGAPRSRWRCFPSEALLCPGLLSGFSDRPALGSGPQSLLASMWWLRGWSAHSTNLLPTLLAWWLRLLYSFLASLSWVLHSLWPPPCTTAAHAAPAFCVVRLISPLDSKDVTENLDSSKEPGVQGNLYVKSEVSVSTPICMVMVSSSFPLKACVSFGPPPLWGGHHQPSSPSSPPRCEAGHKHLEVMEVWGENGSRAASAEKLSS